MPEEDHSKSPGSGFVSKRIGPLPLWAWALIGASAVGVLYIVRNGASSSGGTSLAGTSAGTGVTSTDPLTLSQLTQQLQNLSTALNNQNNPAITPSVQQELVATANQNFTAPGDWPKGLLPLYGSPTGKIQWVPNGTSLAVIGNITPYGIPVEWLGQTYLLDPTQWNVALGNAPGNTTVPPIVSGTAGGGQHAAITTG